MEWQIEQFKKFNHYLKKSRKWLRITYNGDRCKTMATERLNEVIERLNEVIELLKLLWESLGSFC